MGLDKLKPSCYDLNQTGEADAELRPIDWEGQGVSHEVAD